MKTLTLLSCISLSGCLSTAHYDFRESMKQCSVACYNKKFGKYMQADRACVCRRK